MKTLVLVTTLILIICSCSYDPTMEKMWYEIETPKELKEILEVIDHAPAEEKINEIMVWTEDNIDYKNTNTNRTLQQAIEDGYGDCRERGLIVLALVNNELNYQGSLNLTDNNGDLEPEHGSLTINNKLYYSKGYRTIDTWDFNDIQNKFYVLH
jgi:hypothetical protein